MLPQARDFIGCDATQWNVFWLVRHGGAVARRSGTVSIGTRDMAHSYSKGDQPVPGFRLMKFLGRGGFGEVWKAIAPGGTEAAIKIISLSGKEGFKEFRAIQRVKLIRHPNLVPIQAFWLKDEHGNVLDDPFADDAQKIRATRSTVIPIPGQEQTKLAELIIAMGLGDKNLLDRLEECKRDGASGIPVGELLDYMESSAKAIDYLNSPRHDLGAGQVAIQHCDIKPPNIMIVGGAAQVCDFGLARVLGGDIRNSVAAVSPAYGAPECLKENKPSHSTDQYSLAISYYELRTGLLPFDDDSYLGVINAHMNGTLNLSKLGDAERQIIKRATAINPDDRYPTSLEMVRELREAIEGGLRVPKPRPAAGGAAEAGSEIVPGYRLVRLLGRGGYGEVWEATAPGGKRVAVKIVLNLSDTKGKQEFRALEIIKTVEHNHLMELHAYWLLDESGVVIPDEIRDLPDAPAAHTLVIAGKLASKNLTQRLEECQKAGSPGIPVEELLHYMRQSADAIDYLNAPHHLLGDRRVSIQHRDIKPENILLTATGTVRVGDFGLAKVLEGTASALRADSRGITLAYAAPEIFQGNVTKWTDQYSLAVTYFHLRTGQLPFDDTSSAYQLVDIHVKGKLELDALPDAERAIIARATSLAADQRFENCTELVRALETACGVMPATDASGIARIDRGHGTATPPFVAPTPTRPPEHLAAPTDQLPESDVPIRGTMVARPLTETGPVRDTAPFDTAALGTDSLRNDDRSVPREAPPRDEHKPTIEYAPTRKRRIPLALVAAAVIVVTGGGYLIFSSFNRTPDESQATSGDGKDETQSAGSPTDTGKSNISKTDPIKPVDAGSTKPAGADKTWIERFARSPRETTWAAVSSDIDELTVKWPKLSSADRRQIADGLAARLRVAIDHALDPKTESDDAQPLIEKLLRLDQSEWQSELLGAKAELMARTDGYLAVRATLQEAEAAANRDDAKLRRLAVQESRIIAADSNAAPEKLREPIKKVADKLLSMVSREPNEPDVYAALTALAPKLADAEIDRAIDALKPNRDRVTGEAKESLNASLRKLTAARVSTRAMAARTADDFRSITADLREAARGTTDAWAWTSLAESLLRQQGNELRVPRNDSDWEAARRAVERTETVSAAGPYARFVRGLVYGAESKWPDAIAEHDEAFPLEAGAIRAAWQNEERRALAAAAYFEAGKAQESADPARAFVSYQRAIDLAPVPTPRQVVALAAAAIKINPPRFDAAAEATNKLIADPGIDALGNDAFEVLRVNALSLAGLGNKSDAFNRFNQLRRRTELVYDIGPVSWLSQILDPAIALGESLLQAGDGAELKRQVARVYGAKGSLIRENATEDWPFADALDVAQAAYDRALELDDQNARTIVGQALVRNDRARAKPGAASESDLIKRLLADAERAIGADGAYAGGHGLKGFALHLAAARESDNAKRFELEREALAAYDKAIDFSERNKAVDRADDERDSASEVAVYYMNRSISGLFAANAQSTKQSIEQYLKPALSDAQKAVDLGGSYKEWAWLALGNAREDMAWLLGEMAFYNDATQAFTEAIQTRDSAQSRLSRGRAYSKWVWHGGANDPGTEAATVNDLNEALRRDPKLDEPHYWLARLYQFQRKFADAEAALTEAIAKGRQNQSPYLGLYLAILAKVQLQSAELATPPAVAKAREARGTAEEAMRTSAAQTALAQLLIGKSWHLENNLSEAEKFYTGALEPSSGALDAEDQADALILLSTVMTTTVKSVTDQKAVDRLLKAAQHASDAAPLTANRKTGAIAHVAAGRALSLAARAPVPGTDGYHRRTAEAFKKALDLAGDEPDLPTWAWRDVRARSLEALAAVEKDTKIKRELLDDAVRELEAASDSPQLKGDGQTAKRNEITQRLRQLREQAKNLR
jgi:serine/threonine protein kinase